MNESYLRDLSAIPAWLSCNPKLCKYHGILYFDFDPGENVFYDKDGLMVDSILEFITPNDLYLFRQDPGCCIFECRYDRMILIELTIDE